MNTKNNSKLKTFLFCGLMLTLASCGEPTISSEKDYMELPGYDNLIVKKRILSYQMDTDKFIFIIREKNDSKFKLSKNYTITEKHFVRDDDLSMRVYTVNAPLLERNRHLVVLETTDGQLLNTVINLGRTVSHGKNNHTNLTDLTAAIINSPHFYNNRDKNNLKP